ncbi:glycosyltransferase family 4 protein [Prosthecobacter vanneervenii]|uniref:Glycosyltransferase involved in cell wall biosynthesis n=1 Tax=Prosthecobacter vanneervenii TaxID=48466 RepID=A0A7W7Y963_9BACT|nr:glycosyltransferase family 4 protein [Prosthecobacter vanneervenii]MBB5031722.1 glycosyltransferase involved in cell wall biosynthesis [Prosthecobacter vanneervenii]
MIAQLGMNLKASAGGVDRYFSGLNNALTRQGVRVAAYGFGDSDKATCLGPANKPLMQRWKAVRSAVVPRRGRLLASHFALYALPALLGRRWDGHVVHFHGPWASESQREGGKAYSVMAKRMLERAVYHRADRFIVLSKAFRDQLCQGYGIKQDRVHIIPGGVEIDHFQPLDMTEARQRLVWPQKQKIIVCVRRLARRMGLETLIEAFAQATVDHPEAKLMIGGQGPLRSELEQQVQRAGLSKNVEFLGFVPDATLPAVYAAADLSIVPSSALEGFGLISLESLSCGTPVLVTPVGGLPDTVQGLGEDLVLKGTSVENIAAGLRGWLDGTLQIPTRKACREHVLRSFTWDRIAREACEVYRQAGWQPE